MRAKEHPLPEDRAAIGGGVRRKHSERIGNRIVGQRGVPGEQDVIADPRITADGAERTDDTAIAYRRICSYVRAWMDNRDEATPRASIFRISSARFTQSPIVITKRSCGSMG